MNTAAQALHHASDQPAPANLGHWAAAWLAFFATAALLGAAPLLGWARAGQLDSCRQRAEPALAWWHGAVAATGLVGLQPRVARATASYVARIARQQGRDADLVGLAANAAQREPAPHPEVTLSSAIPVTAPVAITAAAPLGEPAETLAEITDKPATSDARTVLLVGDSLMSTGLAPSVMAALRPDASFRVIRASRSATGLTRPDYFDWQRAIKELVAKHRPQFVVVAMGGNDAQGMREGKAALRLNTPAWDAAYRGRVAAFAKSASADGARLLWVGIPMVRSGAFWNNLKHLNELAEAGVKEVSRGAYMDASPSLTDDKGQFAEYLADEAGRSVRLRTGDGVHLTNAGGARVAKKIVAWLREQVATK